MNIALRPAVRCHYDAAENILRVVLMEQLVVEGKDAKDEVVIYALKVGHTSFSQWTVIDQSTYSRDGHRRQISRLLPKHCAQTIVSRRSHDIPPRITVDVMFSRCWSSSPGREGIHAHGAA